jgi:hypothetical protein
MEVGQVQRMRLFFVGVLSLVASFAIAAPATAQDQEGLINLAVTDVNVQVPVAVAANICDVNANVLATQERDGGAICEADATSLASSGKGDRDGTVGQGGTQDGLVNVFISDVNVQVPISVAANVCDLNVNVLAEQLRDGGANCDADAAADATRNRGANA